MDELGEITSWGSDCDVIWWVSEELTLWIDMTPVKLGFEKKQAVCVDVVAGQVHYIYSVDGPKNGQCLVAR